LGLAEILTVKGAMMKGERVLFGASVILLALIAALTIFGSLQSAAVALSSGADRVGSVTFDQLRGMGAEDAVQAIRGRRVTAATWALGYAVLFALVVLVPYRRKERWAWWALLISMVVPQLISLARLPFIGTTVGTLPPAMLLAFGLLGLLAGAPHLFLHRVEPL
jgi:hypothetical protein